jgi:tripartite ATP-independent transporter DctP family solute receptor
MTDRNARSEQKTRREETMIVRRRAIGLAAALLSAPFLIARSSGPAGAQQKMTLKASDVHPEGYPTVAAVEAMGDELAKQTNGRLSIQMFASMQLGGEKETIEQTQIGAIALVRVSVGALGPVINDLNVLNLPFLFRDTAHMEAVIDGPIGQELLDKITQHPTANLIGLGWMDSGARSMYDTKRPIRDIDDLKGLKMRVMGNPMLVDMMNALGGNGVAMGYDQVFTALQTGVVDGAENNEPSFVFDNHYQAAHYYSLTEHLIVPEILVFSKRIFNQLTPDDQALILKLGKKAQQDERVLWKAYEAKARAKMQEAGIVVVDIKDKKPFQDAEKPVWAKYAPQFSDIIKRIEAVQ